MRRTPPFTPIDDLFLAAAETCSNRHDMLRISARYWPPVPANSLSLQFLRLRAASVRSYAARLSSAVFEKHFRISSAISSQGAHLRTMPVAPRLMKYLLASGFSELSVRMIKG